MMAARTARTGISIPQLKVLIDEKESQSDYFKINIRRIRFVPVCEDSIDH
jgi:hypothetical protein